MDSRKPSSLPWIVIPFFLARFQFMACKFAYWFNHLESEDQHLLYKPLLSIPVSGIIPAKPTVFQMAIPCTGSEAGIATFLLGLQVNDRYGYPIKGSPIKLRLKKQCKAFNTMMRCDMECKNGGVCNRDKHCDCPRGFYGEYCDIATSMCIPTCDNNGMCVNDVCKCPIGFHGDRCEQKLCKESCKNGGVCIKEDICWCTTGYYGKSCQYSACITPCKNGGICIGQNKCRCAPGFSGPRCGSYRRDPGRPRRSHKKRHKRRKQKRRNRRLKRKRLLKAQKAKEKGKPIKIGSKRTRKSGKKRKRRLDKKSQLLV